MIYKTFKHPNYNVIGAKTDRFKSCQIEVIFKKQIEKHDLIERILLADTMCFSTKELPKRKDLLAKYQDLYDISISTSVNKIGNCLFTSFNCSFLNPRYVEEKDYLNSVINMLFELIYNPNIKNNSFDINSFNIVKSKLKTDINNINEDPNKVAISSALNNTFKNSPTSYGIINENDYLSDISADDLYNIYLEMINNDLCDIFFIGNIDLNTINDLITTHYKNNIIKTKTINMYLTNKTRNKPLKKIERGGFVQSNLVMIYNLSDLPKDDIQITPYIFNNIFGNGSLNSKLFKYLREDNSLCYSVNCIYLRFDGLLIIKVSLATKNIKEAIKLIKKALKEMIKGDFTEEDIQEAKKSAIFSVKMGEEYIDSLLNNYIFNYYDDFDLPNDRIKKIKSIKKSNILSFAKKLKLNSIYILESEE